MTESLKETIARMESELKDMRAKVEEDADHTFKAGDKVLIEAVVSRDGVDDDGDVRVHVIRANGRKLHTYVGPLEVRGDTEEITKSCEEEPTTPCEKLGYKVGDEFIVIDAGDDDTGAGFGKGTRVRLSHDDCSDYPEFENLLGELRYLAINHHNQVQKINK